MEKRDYAQFALSPNLPILLSRTLSGAIVKLALYPK
jgi:hypothetical protein